MSLPPSLVFDAHSPTTPCFYHADTTEDPLGGASDASDNSLMDPTSIPANDSMSQMAIQKWMFQPHFARPLAPGTCTVSPPGFVCGPLPALAGSIVKCVPRMDHSNLNQLAARVLPLTTSRSNSVLDDPLYPDPRYKFFPADYPPALSRCCGGKFVNPLDVVPPPCNASNSVYQRVLPNIRAHEIDASQMGFQKNLSRGYQSAVSAKARHDDTSTSARLGAWEIEARRLPNNSMLERLRLMTMPHQPDWVLRVRKSRRELIYQFF